MADTPTQTLLANLRAELADVETQIKDVAAVNVPGSLSYTNRSLADLKRRKSDIVRRILRLTKGFTGRVYNG